MTTIRFIVLFLTVPALCATDVEQQPIESDVDLRQNLEGYVYQLTVQCDLQIEEIAAAIPPDDVEDLRREHYAWKLNRDIHCASAGRNSSDPLNELHCLAELTSEYFDRHELEISTIEARQAKTPAHK